MSDTDFMAEMRGIMRDVSAEMFGVKLQNVQCAHEGCERSAVLVKSKVGYSGNGLCLLHHIDELKERGRRAYSRTKAYEGPTFVVDGDGPPEPSVYQLLLDLEDTECKTIGGGPPNYYHRTKCIPCRARIIRERINAAAKRDLA
jgi:hypothetical protein